MLSTYQALGRKGGKKKGKEGGGKRKERRKGKGKGKAISVEMGKHPVMVNPSTLIT
jgi:hypothetical protein